MLALLSFLLSMVAGAVLVAGFVELRIRTPLSSKRVPFILMAVGGILLTLSIIGFAMAM